MSKYRGVQSCFAVALALMILLVGLVGSASGAIVGLERAGATTGFSSAGKSVTASCPAGKRVLGTGADINGGSGEVVMAGLIPNAALTKVTVRGFEYGNGFAGSWSLGASALCATPLPGLERVVATSETDSYNKGVSVSCSAGKKLLGTGAEIRGANGQVELDDLIPTSLTSVSAAGIEDENGTYADWSVVAYAICANPVAGLQRVVATSATDSSQSKSAVANCPAGMQVTGVGGDLKGGAGQVVMDDLSPFPNPATSVQVVGLEDENGTAASWSVTAYAICANSAELVVATSAPGSEPLQGATANCAGGKRLTGVGGDITGGFGEVALQDLVPSGQPASNVAANAWEDQTGTLRNWSTNVYGICATPLAGLERVSVSTPFDSIADQSVPADCSAGKRVLGAAGAITSSSGEVLLAGMFPDAVLTSVTVVGAEDQDTTNETWAVTAHAICATPPRGLQLVAAESESDSQEIKVVTASCPTGKNLVGTGAELSAVSGEVVLDDIRPNPTLTNVTVTAIEDETGAGFNWDVKAHAICANP